MNEKPNFQLCHNLALELLAKQKLTDSMVDVRSLRYDKKIIFDSIQGYAKTTNTPISNYINPETQLLDDGCCIPLYDRDIYVVLYNDSLNKLDERLNWTLAHEIGHVYRRHRKDSAIEEIEANFFASQLLMPEYVLYMIKKNWGLNAYDLCKIFNVSLQAAQKRINTFNKLIYISKSSFDYDIWRMMEPCIRNYYFMRNSSTELKRFISMPTMNI